MHRIGSRTIPVFFFCTFSRPILVPSFLPPGCTCLVFKLSYSPDPLFYHSVKRTHKCTWYIHVLVFVPFHILRIIIRNSIVFGVLFFVLCACSLGLWVERRRWVAPYAGSLGSLFEGPLRGEALMRAPLELRNKAVKQAEGRWSWMAFIISPCPLS